MKNKKEREGHSPSSIVHSGKGEGRRSMDDTAVGGKETLNKIKMREE